MTLLNGKSLTLRKKDKLGLSGGIFILKQVESREKFKVNLKLSCPWKLKFNATLVLN